eukprot:TRINITY_DN21323_c1_g2_i1.p1 TRINITY_DN21323_c1_g2~~TRINITY_DN21323_c1_g2_i1.p1  ORF type:complete len:609 (+),score=140.69 TRINITY_DN21323_c1_g2_i1:73-1899(+)
MSGEFVLDVAADLYGAKENLEIRFPARPSLRELRSKSESLLQTEATVQRPPGAVPQSVRLERFQLFDDATRDWVDLVTSDQLHPYAQLYAFQEHEGLAQPAQSSPGGRCEGLPQPSPPRTRVVVPEASPTRERVPLGERAPTLQELREEATRLAAERERRSQMRAADNTTGKWREALREPSPAAATPQPDPAECAALHRQESVRAQAATAHLPPTIPPTPADAGLEAGHPAGATPSDPALAATAATVQRLASGVPAMPLDRTVSARAQAAEVQLPPTAAPSPEATMSSALTVGGPVSATMQTTHTAQPAAAAGAPAPAPEAQRVGPARRSLDLSPGVPPMPQRGEPLGRQYFAPAAPPAAAGVPHHASAGLQVGRPAAAAAPQPAAEAAPAQHPLLLRNYSPQRPLPRVHASAPSRSSQAVSPDASLLPPPLPPPAGSDAASTVPPVSPAPGTDRTHASASDPSRPRPASYYQQQQQQQGLGGATPTAQRSPPRPPKRASSLPATARPPAPAPLSPSPAAAAPPPRAPPAALSPVEGVPLQSAPLAGLLTPAAAAPGGGDGRPAAGADESLLAQEAREDQERQQLSLDEHRMLTRRETEAFLARPAQH